VYESYHLGDEVPPSTAVAFVTKIGEIGKSTSCSAVQVKNWRKTVDAEDEFNIISWLEKIHVLSTTVQILDVITLSRNDVLKEENNKIIIKFYPCLIFLSVWRTILLSSSPHIFYCVLPCALLAPVIIFPPHR
jgi:hypothetical protein